MAGNRLLPRTVYKGGKTRLGRWASTTFIIQANGQMSNKFAFCRNTGLCVKCLMLALTFPAGRAIINAQGDARYEQAPPRGGNPTVAAQHTYLAGRELSSQTRESSVGADGSLLFVVCIAQIQHERHNAGDGA